MEKEEPCSFCDGTGQVVSSTTISGFKTCDCINIPQEEPIQETLEEAADNWVRKPVIGTKRESFIAGANYQAERMYSDEPKPTIKQVDYVAKKQEKRYSDEEVLELLLSRPGPYLTDEEIKEWFEQFKKK